MPANYIHIYHLLHQGATDVPIPFRGGRIADFGQLAALFYIYWLVLILGSEAVLNLIWRRRLKEKLDQLRDQLERFPVA